MSVREIKTPDVVSALLTPLAESGVYSAAAPEKSDLQAFRDELRGLAPAELAARLRLSDSPERVRQQVGLFMVEQAANIYDGYATIRYQAVRGDSVGNDQAAEALDPAVWLKEVIDIASKPLLGITKKTSAEQRDQLIQKALVTFYNGMRDYHVSAFTTNSAVSRLGFRMLSEEEGANRRYFVHFAAPGMLGPERAEQLYRAEVLEIEGVPVQDYALQFLASGEPRFISKIDTDHKLADTLSTVRVGALGMETPKGSVPVKFRLKDGTETTLDVTWKRVSNSMPGPGVRPSGPTAASQLISQQTGELAPEGCLSFCARKPTHDGSAEGRKLAALIRKADRAQLPGNNTVGFRNIVAQRKGFTMMHPLAARIGELDLSGAENRQRVGAVRSYLPRIGDVVEEAPADALFDHYMTRVDGELVGAVRINTFSVSDPDAYVKAFGDIIAKFKAAGCKSLMIDGVKNPGGSVPYLYALFSHLSPNRLETPLHMSRVTREDAASARELLQLIQDLRADMPDLNEHEFAQALFGESFGGYPVTPEILQNFVDELQHELSQFEAGKGDLTEGFHISAVNYINP
ncbi:MAG: PDZ domain-containing protein, partial [Myxococcota bacterium]